MIRRSIAAAMPNAVVTLQSKVFPARDDRIVRARQMVWDVQSGHRDCGTAALLAGELAANSVAHSGSRLFGLAIARTVSGVLWVAVADEGCKGFPRLRGDTSGARCGRGLRLVDSLACRWGITRQAHAGVAVWFECGGRLRSPSRRIRRR